MWDPPIPGRPDLGVKLLGLGLWYSGLLVGIRFMVLIMAMGTAPALLEDLWAALQIRPPPGQQPLGSA